MNCKVLFGLCVLGVVGVKTDEVEQVSETEGHNITLHTGINVTDIGANVWIIWTFNSTEETMAQLRKINNEVFVHVHDTMKMDNKSGDLSITNISTNQSGFYTLQKIINGKESKKIFISVRVNAHLSVPVIHMECSSNNSSNPQCVLNCSVEKWSQEMTLSWYENNSLIPNNTTCNSDVDWSTCLEVNCQDENHIYNCVVSNSLTNQTSNFTVPCQQSEPENPHKGNEVVEIVMTVLLVFAVAVAVALLVHYYKKCKQQIQEGRNSTENEELQGVRPSASDSPSRIPRSPSPEY